MFYERAQHSVRQLAAEIYAERRNYLLAIARRNAANQADAEEALQEAFVAFIRAFDPKGGAPPLAWLTLTLKRQCWKRRREAHLERRLGQEAERGGGELGSVIESIPSPEVDLEERVVERDQARRQVGALKPDEGSALCLQAVGYSYREIAERRGWTYTKVNRCISEGRAALRRGQRAE
jgi:RNA polymerase sigma factor (sigma-70 family)